MWRGLTRTRLRVGGWAVVATHPSAINAKGWGTPLAIKQRKFRLCVRQSGEDGLGFDEQFAIFGLLLF